MYCRRFKYERTIFDMDRIQILNAVEIEINDCIFTGTLRIGNNERSPLHISMDYVAFGKGLIISGANNDGSVGLYCINSPEVEIADNEIHELSFSSCNICYLIIYNSIINEFSSYFNRLDTISVSKSIMSTVVFPHGQIDIFEQKAVPDVKWIKSLKNKFSYLSFSNRVDYHREAELEKLKDANETFRFLIGRSDYHLDKVKLSRLKYLEIISSINHPVKRFIYRIFGGLIIPWRILVIIVFVIVLFSFLYLIPCLNFNIPGADGGSTQRGLFILEALYFSGTSFTTIGYGDIAPEGYARILAVSEGILGVILLSSFLVSIIRRYLE